MPEQVKPQITSLSRRTFLKGSAAAIVAALASLNNEHFLAHGIFAPRLSRAASGTVVLLMQANYHDFLSKNILPEFESSTGLKVKLEAYGGVGGVDMMTTFSTAFAAGTSNWDVISDSDESSPLLMRAGWLEPLDEVIPKETWADFPESMKAMIDIWHTFEGKRYRIPHGFDMGYFFTRKDWLDERKLKAPTTWDEMVEVGKQFTDSGKGIWGTTDGLVKPALLFVYIAYLASQSGGAVFEFDDGTAKAFQFLYDMIHKHQIFPNGALNNDYNAQNQLYLQDKVAFMRQWSFVYDVAQADTKWFAPEKLVVTLPPAGPAGSHSWTGAWGFEVPKFAPNPDGAKELVKFLSSNATASKLAAQFGFFLSPRASIVKEVGVEKNFTLKNMVMYSDAKVPTARPFHPKVAQAQGAVEDMASLFLLKQSSLSEVMAQGKQLIAALSN